MAERRQAGVVLAAGLLSACQPPLGRPAQGQRWEVQQIPIEVMRVSGGTTQVIGQVRDAGAEATIGGVTNLYNFFGAC